MSDDWHEQIQRHLNGLSSPEESSALAEALDRDPQVRALYLDYMNLDATLGAMAETAPVGALAEDGRPDHRPEQSRLPWNHWRWLAPAAACAALLVFGLVSERRHVVPARPDLSVATLSVGTAISRLPSQVPPPIPAWMSPTASLLERPTLYPANTTSSRL